MPTTATVNARHEVLLHGNPSSPPSIAKALAEDYPLLLAAEHRWATLLPDALPDRPSNTKATRYADLSYPMIAGGLVTEAVANQGMHFAVGLARQAKFFADLDVYMS